MTKKFTCLTLLCLVLLSMAGCKDDNDDGPDTGITGDPVRYSSLITGLWYCTLQQWDEDGEQSEEHYTPSSLYSMRFDKDGTGYMKSGDDSLFEIMNAHSFRWNIRNIEGVLYLHTDVYGGETYKILYLKGDKLVMEWRDDNFSIKCEFIRNK